MTRKIGMVLLMMMLAAAMFGCGGDEAVETPQPAEDATPDGGSDGAASGVDGEGLAGQEAIGESFPRKIPLPPGEVLSYQVLDGEPGVVMHNVVIRPSGSGVADWYLEALREAGFEITDVSPSKENVSFSDGTIEGYTDISDEAFALNARVPE